MAAPSWLLLAAHRKLALLRERHHRHPPARTPREVLVRWWCQEKKFGGVFVVF